MVEGNFGGSGEVVGTKKDLLVLFSSFILDIWSLGQVWLSKKLACVEYVTDCQ